jgi:radical SAM-linked protein
MRTLLQLKKFSTMIYTSHVDSINIIENVLRRSKCPFEFSRGFNPKPIFSFSEAIPLGYINRCFYMTVDTKEKFDFFKLNSFSPKGLSLLSYKIVEDAHKITKKTKGYYFKIYLSENLFNYFSSLKTIKKGKSEYLFSEIFNNFNYTINSNRIFVIQYYQEKNNLINFYKIIKEFALSQKKYFYYPICHNVDMED